MKVIKTKNSAKDCPSTVPWFLLADHQEQAFKNHSQSLARLNSRGGCSIQEIYAIMTDQPYSRSTDEERHAIDFVKTRINEAYQYGYIYFVLADILPRTSVWNCYAKFADNKLGQIRWYGPWRQYCFRPSANAIFNIGCMEDINDFIGKQMQARGLAKQAEQANRGEQ